MTAPGHVHAPDAHQDSAANVDGSAGEDADAAVPRNFRELVWAVVRSIPPGRVMTYGQIAALLGAPRSAHAVGYVLYATPEDAEVPCQRVVNRWGSLARSYGWGGALRHRADLEAEGVAVRPDDTVDLTLYVWTPPSTRAAAWETENLRRLHERPRPSAPAGRPR